jgi:predicted RNA binding protein with dsRBD fold (UPF0201 family)
MSETTKNEKAISAITDGEKLEQSQSNTNELTDYVDYYKKLASGTNLTNYNILETIRSEIQAEHLLISHRMTWYVTSQAF